MPQEAQRPGPALPKGPGAAEGAAARRDAPTAAHGAAGRPRSVFTEPGHNGISAAKWLSNCAALGH